MERVRWGFVGAGRQPRLWIGPAVVQAENAEPVGVWNRSPEAAAVFAAELAVDRLYATYAEMLEDERIDAVYIATPNNLHHEHAIAALKAGKHVLVEKPMAVSVAMAAEMVSVARGRNRLLGVGFHLRHHVLMQEAKRLIDQGTIGEIQFATANFNLTSSRPPRAAIPHGTWKQDAEQMGHAGVLMGMGVHLIDLLRFLTGQEVTAVQAMAATEGGGDIEPFGQSMLTFGAGLPANITYGGTFPLHHNDVVLYGSKGRLTVADAIDVHTAGSLNLVFTDGVYPSRREEFFLDVIDHYQRQVEAFSRSVLTAQPFSASGEDGLRVVEVASAAIESRRTGCIVRLE